VTLAQAEAFLILAEELHFGRAADRLYLSQARVSRLIASLEAEVGGLLFERTSRRVRITPLGAQLQLRLRTAVDLLEEGLEEARAAARGSSGSLQVGFTAATGGAALRAVIEAFEASHPDCEVVEREVPLADTYCVLREIDVLCTWLVFDEPTLAIGPVIALEERVVAVASDHPLAAKEEVLLEDLGGCPVCEPIGLPRPVWEKCVPTATPLGVPLPRAFQVTSANEIFALVGRGKAVHPTVRAMEALYPRPGVVFIPIADMAPLPLGLIWVRAHENARIRAFAQVAETVGAGDRKAAVGAAAGAGAARMT
jgi:DNA-binding transcriptional LysR family regulator